MAKLIKVLLFTVGGYIAGFIAGLALIYLLSANTHDFNQEMGMTSIFFTGPIGALIGFFWGIFGRSRAAK
jgi:hypothetical protein